MKGTRSKFYMNEPDEQCMVTLTDLRNQGYHPIDKLSGNQYRFSTLAKALNVSSIVVTLDKNVELELADKSLWQDSRAARVNPSGEII